MLNFGFTDNFQIQHYPYIEEYKDNLEVKSNPSNYILGGTIYFWINRKNIFAYKNLGPEATYSFPDLSILVQFFCDYLFFHITDDPFPAPTNSKVAINMLDEYKLVEGPDNDVQKYAYVNWDDVDLKLHDEIFYWNSRHGFIANHGGSFLPNAYFRKVENKIEVSWRNEFPYRSTGGEFYAEHKEGVELIDIKLYRDTIVAFCMEILSRMEQVYPKRAAEFRENLQKAIDVKL